MNHSKLDLIILKHILTFKKDATEFSQTGNEKLLLSDYWRFTKIIIDYIKTYKEPPTSRVLIDKLSNGKNESLINYCKEILEKINEIDCVENEWSYYFEQLKIRFSQNLMKSLKENLVSEDGRVDVNKNISEIQNTVSTIKSLTAEKAFDAKTLKDAIPQFREEYVQKQKDPLFDKGMQCGFKKLDEILGGFRESELHIIGGESGSGKSLLLQAIGTGLWLGKNKINDHTETFQPGQNILYFSLEMPLKNCFARTVSSLACVPTRKLRDAQLDEEETNKLKETIQFINRYPYSYEIVDLARGATPSAIERIYLERKETTNPKIIIVDYMGLMKPEDGNGEEDWLALGKISESLHEMARVNQLCIVSAVQLNRVKPKADASERVGAHRISRSASIINNCNSLLMISARQNEKNYPTMEIHTIKNREGTNESFQLLKNFTCSKISDYEELETYDAEKDISDIDT